MQLLININIIITCALIGFVCCGTFNIWYNLIRYDNVNTEIVLSVVWVFIAILINIFCCFY